MKKKLFLLPIALFSSFLGACEYRTEFIPLKDIFNIDKNGCYGYYYYDNQEYTDLKDDVFSILKTYISDAEYVKSMNGNNDVKPYYNIKTIDYRFNISGDYKKMNYFIINAYETGNIEVRVSGAGWPMSPQDQNSIYKISEESAAELFSTVGSYVEDMNTGMTEEKEAAKEASTIDKFLTAYSSLESRTITYTYSFYDRNVKRQCVMDIFVPDEDGEYLELLVDLEYKRYDVDEFRFSERYTSVDSSNCLRIDANEDWYMIIDYRDAVGCVYYEYESKYQGPSVYYYYISVNQNKCDALYKKIYNEIKDQIEGNN